jgi:hypothetical protein
LVLTRTFYITTPFSTKNTKAKPEEEFFWGRWQPDAFVFRDVKKLADVHSTDARLNFLVGKYQNNYWSISSDGKMDLLEYWTDNNTASTNNPVEMTVIAARNILNLFLRMGAPLVDFQLAEWNGNDFTTVSARGEPIKGSLLVENNKPRKLIFDVAGNPYFSNRTEVIEYYFEKNPGLPFLPSRIEISNIKGGKTTRIAECTIVSVETSGVNLDKKFFEAKQFYVPNERSILFFTNNAEYALRNGRLVLARQTGSPRVQRELKVIRAVLVFFLFSALFSAMYLLRGKFINSRTNKKTPK